MTCIELYFLYLGFHRTFKYPQNCKVQNSEIQDCKYYIEMMSFDRNIITFHVLFENNDYIRIGLSEYTEKVSYL